MPLSGFKAATQWLEVQHAISGLLYRPPPPPPRNIQNNYNYTVKPVFKGHSDERTPCKWSGDVSSKWCPIFSILRNLQRRDTCHEGHFLVHIELSFEDRFYCIKAWEAFRSGREYHHVTYVNNRERQRQGKYLILLKKINPGIKMI